MWDFDEATLLKGRRMKPGHEPIPESVRRLRNPALDLDREAIAREIMALRRMLALVYCADNPGLYGDDGELQLGGYPHPIDFNRDSAEKIEQAIHARSVDSLVAWIKANPEEAAKQGFKLTKPHTEGGE